MNHGEMDRRMTDEKEPGCMKGSGDAEAERLSLAYWSGRAEEFSGLRMTDYDSPMKSAFTEFLKEKMTAVRTGTGYSDLRTLDLGCGAGFFALIMADMGCQATGVDFSREMLDQARRNAMEKGLDEICFRQMDAQSLDFPDESFDFIITRNVTWILPDAGKAYDEMMRVLRTGGRLINLDANYGKAFNEADRRGEMPSHPTQTMEQLRMRNRIARNLDITRAERPQWDMMYLWDKGVRNIQCIRDIEEYLGIRPWNQNYTRASAKSGADMFAIIGDK